MKRFLKLVVVCSFLLLPYFSSAVAEEIAVIVNPANSIGELSKSQVKKTFLGKQKRFDNGLKVRLIDSNDDDLKEKFYKKVTKKSMSQLKAYWSRLVFSGKGKQPKSSSKVKEWIAEHENGIGYISADDIDESIKVVLKIQ